MSNDQVPEVVPLFATDQGEPSWILVFPEDESSGQSESTNQPAKCLFCGSPEHGDICQNI